MAKVCQITGRKRMVGNNVSHSKRRTKRIFAINLKNKRFWSETEQRFITLKVSCKGMRNIEKNGLDATIKDAQKKGFVNVTLVSPCILYVPASRRFSTSFVVL